MVPILGPPSLLNITLYFDFDFSLDLERLREGT
jgi:hypothetical protein